MTKSDSQKLDEIAKLQQDMLEVQKRMLERQDEFGKRLYQIDQRQEQFGKSLQQFDQRQEQFEKRQEQFDQRQGQFEKHQDRFGKRIDRLEERIDRSQERMDRFERNTKSSFDKILELHARVEQRLDVEQQKNEDFRIQMLAYADRGAKQHENFQIEKTVLGAQIDRIALNDADQNRKITDLTQRVERLEQDAR